MKTLIFTICLLFSSIVYANDNVILVLNRGECPQSRSVEKHFRSKELLEILTRKKINYCFVYNDTNQGYIKRHKIKWFPTILRFNDQWVEKNRIVGCKDLNFWFEFFGEPKVESLPIPEQVVQLPVYKIAPSKGKT